MTAPVVDADRALRLGASDQEDALHSSSDAAATAPLEITDATHGNQLQIGRESRNDHATLNDGRATSPSSVDELTHRLGIHNDFCFFCRGFYGPSFGLPVCGPCHAFLFPERVGEAECVEEVGVAAAEEKDDSGDSGNEEPTDFLGAAAAAADRPRKRGGGAGSRVCGGCDGGGEASCVGGGVGFGERFVTFNVDDGVGGDYVDDDASPGYSNRVPRRSFSNLHFPQSPTHQSVASPLDAPESFSLSGCPGVEPDGSSSSSSSSAASSAAYLRISSQSTAAVEDSSRFATSSKTQDRRDVGCGLGLSGNSTPVVAGGVVVGGANGVHVNGVAPRPIRPSGFSRLSASNNGTLTLNVKSEKLAEKLLQMTTTKDKELVPPRLVDSLPPEVLIAIFGFLDDLSLWTAMQVSARWHHLIADEYPDDRWRVWLRMRWPLFEPLLRPRSWRVTYSRMVTSSPCLLCLEQMMLRNSPIEENSWRHRRLRSELKALQSDPPEGIQATPLDRFYCHWQATITGPHGSPYEGGVFFLSMQIPPSYPMKPPVVRFLTKTFHPNISRHGDIGLDSIHHNWSLALTISKVLISIQSLLTDPFIETSMEPQISALIRRDMEEYNRVARIWTWRYAMHDVMAVSDGALFDGP